MHAVIQFSLNSEPSETQGLNRGSYRELIILFALRRRAMHMNYSASRLHHATSFQLLQDHHL